MVKTPQEKWKESIITYRKKCQKILNLSKSIRYAGIINEYGRTLTGLVRPNTTPLWSAERPESAGQPVSGPVGGNSDRTFLYSGFESPKTTPESLTPRGNQSPRNSRNPADWTRFRKGSRTRLPSCPEALLAGR